MSSASGVVADRAADVAVCEFCGMPIEEVGQDCPALFLGGCRA